MNAAIPGDLIPPREAARVCGVTAGTVLRWIHEGRMPGYRRAGTRYKVSRADAERMLQPVVPDDRPDGVATAGEIAHRVAACMVQLAAMGVK